MIADVITLIQFLRESTENLGTISAMFNSGGERMEGSEEIVVQKTSVNQHQWFYKVDEKEGYVFVYMPTIPSVYADYGMSAQATNSDARFFRFVAHPVSTLQVGGAKNVLVDFIVVGYRPSNLLRQKERTMS